MTDTALQIPDWRQIDTVLFDLDGTLLDLSYDNHVWREIVPQAYAAARSVTAQEALDVLKSHLRARAGTLDWYCMNYWSRELALDVTELHRAHAARIGWLPGARETLIELRARGKRLVLMTNAHPHTLQIKEEQLGIRRYFDAVFSSHDFGAPKEDASFWPLVRKVERFDPERTLFVDDNAAVLKAARAAGIRFVYAMCHPDSSRPPRLHPDFPSVHSVAELL
ncbi:MAG TPA: GMP/IMP nucleotidase [Steroidobacteraceae bacterium]